MNDSDQTAGTIQASLARISGLGAASLRLDQDPDLDAALGEALAAARALTSARRGAVATRGEAGEPGQVVTSDFAEPPDWLRSLSDGPDRPLPEGVLTVPLHHRGGEVGRLVLAEKDGGFEAGDADILGPVAAQAAVVVALARAEAAAERIGADLDALVQTAPVGVVVFDAATGAVLWINQEAKRIVEGLRTAGRTAEQMLEVITLRRADGRETDLSQSPLVELLRAAETVRGEEIVVSAPDGRNVTMLVNTTPVRTGHGGDGSVVVTMQDLAPIQELERLRSEFLGMVSHELRAPLTSIKGSAATLLETGAELDPAVMREFFRIIADQADHMNGLINDLLDAGRIDAGTLSVSPEPSALAALVDRARNTFLSGGGLHTVLIDLPPDLPAVAADRRRIVQVLNNLFANAAGHAPASSPIRVAALRDGVHVAVSVTDEGRGVAPERLPQLFQKYARAGTDDRGLAGTGLGLAICKGLVEAHGGRVWAESAGIGQGARVTFTLPVAEEAAARSAAAHPRASCRDAPESTRILVVDDDPQALCYARDALKQAGYAPLLTGDHRELARIVRTERPHLVVLDLVLPETDGIELMRTVPELAELPVIFVSAYGRDETIARALEAGAVDYIVKPFSTTELAARIRAALRRRAEHEPFVLGELAIHYGERRVSLAGRPVDLTPSEYELLRVLSLEGGRVVDYASLLQRVSGKPNDFPARVALRTLAKSLRTKLGERGDDPAYILTVRGVGYRMPRPDAD